VHFHMRTKSLLILTGAHCSKPANNVFVSHNRHCSSPIHSLWQTFKTNVAGPRWPRSSRVPPWHPPTYPPDELNENQVMTSFRPPPRRVDFAIFKCCWVIGGGSVFKNDLNAFPVRRIGDEIMLWRLLSNNRAVGVGAVSCKSWLRWIHVLHGRVVLIDPWPELSSLDTS